MAEDTVNTMDADSIDPAEWKAVSFTHVEYPKGDVLGFILAWFSLIPFMLLVSLATLIIFRRDLHTISLVVGLFINEFFNLVFKYAIKQPRPLRGRQNLYTEYGMPSSHSQFVWFFSAYFSLFLIFRLYRNYSLLEDLWKYAVAVLAVVCAVLVSWSRIYLRYHTVSQVFCGGLLGAVIGILWFGAVQFLLTPIFPLIASSPVGEFFMLRDSTLIPYVMWFEYTCSRSEARSRQRKMSSRKSQ